MCAPVGKSDSGGSKTESYNLKEFNSEPNYTPKDEMEIKGLIEKEDVRIYSNANTRSKDSDERTSATSTAINNINAYSLTAASVGTLAIGGAVTLEVIAAIIDAVLELVEQSDKYGAVDNTWHDSDGVCGDPQHHTDDDHENRAEPGEYGSGAEINDKKPKQNENQKSQPETPNEAKQESKNQDKENSPKGSESPAGESKTDSNKTKNMENPQTKNDREQGERNRNSDNNKTTIGNLATKLNNAIVKAVENITPVLKNIGVNYAEAFKLKVKQDLYKVAHPFKTIKNQAISEWNQIAHPFKSFKAKAVNDINKFKFLVHSEKDQNKIFEQNIMREQIIANLEQYKKMDASSKDGYMERMSERMATKIKKEYKIDNIDIQTLQTKIELYWKQGAERDQITQDALTKEGVDKYEDLSKETKADVSKAHAAINRNATADEIKSMLGVSSSTDISDIIGKGPIGAVGGMDRKEEDIDKMLIERADKFDEYIAKFSQEGYIPSIQELKEVDDFLNGGLLGSSNSKSEARIRVLENVEGAKSFLQSSFEFEIRHVENHHSALNEKIDEFVKYKEIKDADIMELAAACSSIGNLSTREIIDSYQAKSVMFDVNIAKGDLRALNKDVDSDQKHNKKGSDEFNELQELLKTIQDINKSFVSKKDDSFHKADLMG